MMSLAASMRWLSSSVKITFARAYLVDESSLVTILNQACENTGFIRDDYHRVFVHRTSTYNIALNRLNFHRLHLDEAQNH